MNALELLIKGILAGLAIAVPVGPVNVLCVSRTIAKGRLSGLISGLGAASADTLYGAIAGFSISLVIGFLIREEFWIRFYGGMLLIGIGIVYWLRKPATLREEKGKPAHSDYVSTLLLTLTNPTTVLSFMAVLAALGMAGHRAPWLTVFLVAGIFCGSMLWWTILAVSVNHFRDRFNDRAMVWTNRIAGLAIGGFGVVTMILSRGHPH